MWFQNWRGQMKRNLWLSENPRCPSEAWDTRVGQHFQSYIWIWESEARAMAGSAARWGNVETGGEVYGLTSHAGRPVIMLVTPPGPNSIHEVAHFRQDLDFFQKINAFLRNNFGLLYGGNFHSHHTLGIKGPSPLDIRSMKSLAQKNGFYSLAQFILTFENKPTFGFHRGKDRLPDGDRMKGVAATRSEAGGCSTRDVIGRIKSRFLETRQANFIRIHSFLYLDAAHGEPVQCPIRIIPGTSPFRRALVRNSTMPELAQPYSFPMFRIFFDSVKLYEPAQHVPELPEWICKQCFELPEDVRKNIRVATKEGLVILSLPLPWAEGTVFLGFKQKPPHKLQGIYFSKTGKEAAPIEISLEAPCCVHSATELARIYEGVVKVAKGEGLAGHLEKSIRMGEIVNSQEGHTGKQGASCGREE